ncbi:hypothetical protein AAII07_36295 [Microvirga sp. 0TCS3.31]
MTSDRPFQEETGATPSPLDLKQIKEAVQDLRASSPRSVLADLVEEKIRMMESRHPGSSSHMSAQQTRWIGH